MLSKIIETKFRILTLLDLVSHPICITKIPDYLGEPMYLINFSLAQLLKEGLIKVETKEGKNFILKEHEENIFAHTH